VRLPLAVLTLGLALVVLAPAASAAPINKTVTPFMNCYWDNGDGTVTVSVGYTSTNAGTVTIPVGPDNRVTPGAANRGQPTTFLHGTQNNAWAVTVGYAEIANDVNWYVTGNSVTVSTPNRCATKPVSQVGSVGALLVGAAALACGALAVGWHRRRRGRGSAA
jgi:hypothetical protein